MLKGLWARLVGGGTNAAPAEVAAPTAEPTPAADRGAGWGLYLVDKLTRSWGAEQAPDAHVWFELEH